MICYKVPSLSDFTLLLVANMRGLICLIVSNTYGLVVLELTNYPCFYLLSIFTLKVPLTPFLTYMHIINLYFRSSNISDEAQLRDMNIQRCHLEAASSARVYMSECIKQAKACRGDSTLTKNKPLSGPPLAHYGFDYAQQVRLGG